MVEILRDIAVLTIISMVMFYVGAVYGQRVIPRLIDRGRGWGALAVVAPGAIGSVLILVVH